MEALADKNFIKKYQKKSDMKLYFKEIIDVLSPRIRHLILNIDGSIIEGVEEIRLRVDRPLIINAMGKDYFLNKEGVLHEDIHNNIIVNKSDIDITFQLITNYSAYAFEEEIRNGFITIKGGHRVGICGKAVIENNDIKTIKDVSGINIRVSREIIGCSDRIIKYILRGSNAVYNTLIVSPPQCGKTTLLRDIVRQISNGIPSLNFTGVNVSVVDERSEIGGTYNGILQKDLGIRTDVLDGCPKAKGMLMLIRAMGPRVIVTDEIGRDEDIYAIREAISAGVNFITTIHGSSLEEISRRLNIKSLIDSNAFERIIILSNKPKVGTVDRIIDPIRNTVIARNL